MGGIGRRPPTPSGASCAVLKGHLSATPAGQRAPGSFAHRAPKTTTGRPGTPMPTWAILARNARGVVSRQWRRPERVWRCGHGTASAEGCVSCGRISADPAGGRSPVPRIGFQPPPPHALRRPLASQACFKRSMRENLLGAAIADHIPACLDPPEQSITCHRLLTAPGASPSAPAPG
jgi:hypothetical protein